MCVCVCYSLHWSMEAIGGTEHYSGWSHLVTQVVVCVCSKPEVPIQQGDERQSLKAGIHLNLLHTHTYKHIILRKHHLHTFRSQILRFHTDIHHIVRCNFTHTQTYLEICTLDLGFRINHALLSMGDLHKTWSYVCVCQDKFGVQQKAGERQVLEP